MGHPHTVAQLYTVPHGILHVFNTKMSFKILSLFPEQTTLVGLEISGGQVGTSKPKTKYL
jgi:hypothetical protein